MAKLFSLRRDEDFKRVLKRGGLLRGSFLSVKILKTENAYARAGIIIGRRISKKATVRNALKRRIRESIRENFAHLAGVDIIVLLLPEVVSKSFQEINSEIKKLSHEARRFITN